MITILRFGILCTIVFYAYFSFEAGGLFGLIIASPIIASIILIIVIALMFLIEFLRISLKAKTGESIHNKFLSALKAKDDNLLDSLIGEIDPKKLFLDNGAETYLTRAIKMKYVRAALKLIEGGAYVDFQSWNPIQRPLEISVGQGDEMIEVTEKLISKGASIGKRQKNDDELENSLIDTAIQIDAPKTVELLIHHGSSYAEIQERKQVILKYAEATKNDNLKNLVRCHIPDACIDNQSF